MISTGISHVDVAGVRAGAPPTECAWRITRIHLPTSTCAAKSNVARDARPRRPAHGRLDLTRATHARIAVFETIWHQEQTPCRSHARRGGSGPVAIVGRPHPLLAALRATILLCTKIRFRGFRNHMTRSPSHEPTRPSLPNFFCFRN